MSKKQQEFDEFEDEKRRHLGTEEDIRNGKTILKPGLFLDFNPRRNIPEYRHQVFRVISLQYYDQTAEDKREHRRRIWAAYCTIPTNVCYGDIKNIWSSYNHGDRAIEIRSFYLAQSWVATEDAVKYWRKRMRRDIDEDMLSIDVMKMTLRRTAKKGRDYAE